MPSKALFQSAGRISEHIIPGSYSRIDSVRASSGNVSANRGVIIGRGYGPKPATLYQFGSSPEALEVIKGGELREAVRLAFSPGMDLAPQSLLVMAVNSSVQASKNLLDGATHAMIAIKSALYGAFNNQIHVSVAAGTVRGKKLLVTYKSSVESHDNIYAALMTIIYASGACTLAIVNNSTTHTMVSSVGGLNADLSTFDTVGDLVGYINSLTGFTATVTAGAELLSPLHLDQVTALDINTGAATLEASMWAMIDTINQNSSLIVATDASAANGINPVAVLADSYLSGGSNGTYTATEWTAALSALEAEDIQFMSSPDPSASVIASCKAHVVLMASVTKRKERQFIGGGAWGDSIATATAEAATLNSAYVSYVFNGGKQYDEFGNIASFSASYAGCMIMSLKTILGINMPLTSKNLDLLSLEQKLKDSDLETLLLAGCMPVSYDDLGLPSIVRQFTTYQADDLKFNEFSMVQIMNFVSRDLRSYLKQKFVGNPGIKGIPAIIEGLVNQRLRSYVELGLFTEDTLGRTFWGVIIRLNADKCYLDYNANITAPLNFMFITQHFSEAI